MTNRIISNNVMSDEELRKFLLSMGIDGDALEFIMDAKPETLDGEIEDGNIE